MKSKLYAAYGTNIDSGLMDYRCPNAKDAGRGFLKNHRLVFRTKKNGRSVATVVSAPGLCVPIRFWEIFPIDEEPLFRYQGCHLASPTYRQTYRGFETEKGPTEALIFIMNLTENQTVLPIQSYFDILVRGYRECGFDFYYLRQAIEEVHSFLPRESEAEFDPFYAYQELYPERFTNIEG